jgi:hypothetical protein
MQGYATQPDRKRAKVKSNGIESLPTTRGNKMKAQFTVVIEGNWKVSGKSLTRRHIEKQLRSALDGEFEFLADRVIVRMINAEPQTTEAGDVQEYATFVACTNDSCERACQRTDCR